MSTYFLPGHLHHQAHPGHRIKRPIAQAPAAAGRASASAAACLPSQRRAGRPFSRRPLACNGRPEPAAEEPREGCTPWRPRHGSGRRIPRGARDAPGRPGPPISGHGSGHNQRRSERRVGGQRYQRCERRNAAGVRGFACAGAAVPFGRHVSPAPRQRQSRWSVSRFALIAGL